jgi:FKBP-type peptidyl-prolyl cis-trans isomerase
MIKLLVPDLMPSLLALVFVVVGMVAAAAAQVPAPDDVAAAPSDAEKSGSGLASKVVQAGTGSDHPSGSDEVTVHYTGWLTNGQMFDSSVTRGQPASFPLNRVIAGWTEGVQLMVVGEKRRFWIPSTLGYGEQGAAGGLIPPGADLVFDVELLSIK